MSTSSIILSSWSDFLNHYHAILSSWNDYLSYYPIIPSSWSDINSIKCNVVFFGRSFALVRQGLVQLQHYIASIESLIVLIGSLHVLIESFVAAIEICFVLIRRLYVAIENLFVALEIHFVAKILLSKGSKRAYREFR